MAGVEKGVQRVRFSPFYQRMCARARALARALALARARAREMTLSQEIRPECEMTFELLGPLKM